jgi:hypothetical protein
MTKRNKVGLHFLAAGALALAGAGCQSAPKKEPVRPDQPVQESADQVEHNRLSVRMAFAENVYNGIATERAVYPKDFFAGTADLNELGRQRVNMLIDASRNASGRIAVLRGDVSDELFAARVSAVRERLADAGVNHEKLGVGEGQVGGETVSSDRAILSYTRMMAEYAPRPQASPKGSFTITPADSNGSSNSRK